MKPKIVITREIFDDVIDYLKQHCDVDANQADVPCTPDALAAKLAGSDGLMCALTDKVDAALVARAPGLKVVANIAVGYNNIDVPACTARGIKVTNTPGVLDDSTADLAFALMLATARRISEVESYIRNGEWTGWKLKQWLGVDVHHATLGIIGTVMSLVHVLENLSSPAGLGHSIAGAFIATLSDFPWAVGAGSDEREALAGLRERLKQNWPIVAGLDTSGQKSEVRSRNNAWARNRSGAAGRMTAPHLGTARS